MTIREKVFSSFLWRFMERCTAQGVNFVVSIILARMLMPMDYGTIALVTIFITILQVFIDSGLGNALIQKKNADNLDFSTVFCFNIIICLMLYGIMFFTAPFISDFFNTELTSVIRVLSLILIISGVKNIQQAYVSRNMLFKRFFFSSLGGAISSAIVGIILVVKGYGIWALVFQQLINATVDTCILWCTINWRPKLAFSIKRLKKLFSFGWKLLLSSLLDIVYNNLRQLFIGKLYTSENLAFFNRGKQFPEYIISNINASIDSTLFPAISSVQDNAVQVKAMTRRAIQISSYIIWPAMIGLSICAEPFVKLLLTDKWLPCVPYLRIFCFIYAFWPMHTANLNAIKAVGRSDIILKLEIFKKVVYTILLIISLNFGVLAIAFSQAISAPLGAFINAYPNKKNINYSYWEQLADILPSLGLSIVMGLIIYPISLMNISPLYMIFIQIIAGVFVYWMGSKLFHFDSYHYIINILKKMLKRK